MNIEIRKAAKIPGRTTGKPFLQEVYSFGEQASSTLVNQGILEDPDPWIVMCEWVGDCDEAFVAEHGGQIVGAATLAFCGTRGSSEPTLEGVYVVRDHRGQGIGHRLFVAAMTRFVELEKVPVNCVVSTSDMQNAIDRLEKTYHDLWRHLKPQRLY